MKGVLLFFLQPQQVLVWACVFVFVCTCIITLLGVIGKIKIDPGYLKKLFYALIVEIVAIGVMAFKDSFKPVAEAAFVKIVSPSNNFKASGSCEIAGAFRCAADERMVCELKTGTTSQILHNQLNSGNIFKNVIDSAAFKNDHSTVVLSIYRNNTLIIADSVTIETDFVPVPIVVTPVNKPVKIALSDTSIYRYGIFLTKAGSITAELKRVKKIVNDRGPEYANTAIFEDVDSSYNVIYFFYTTPDGRLMADVEKNLRIYLSSYKDSIRMVDLVNISPSGFIKKHGEKMQEYYTPKTD